MVPTREIHVQLTGRHLNVKLAAGQVMLLKLAEEGHADHLLDRHQGRQEVPGHQSRTFSPGHAMSESESWPTKPAGSAQKFGTLSLLEVLNHFQLISKNYILIY